MVKRSHSWGGREIVGAATFASPNKIPDGTLSPNLEHSNFIKYVCKMDLEPTKSFEKAKRCLQSDYETI